MIRAISPAHLFFSCVTLASILVVPILKAATPAREIYLLLGQSNMAGRGKVEPIDKQITPGLWMFTEAGEWKPATEPTRFDKPGMVGVGPGLAFAKAIQEKRPGIEVGIINRSFGGTAIAQWKQGGKLYQDAVEAAKAAAKAGTLKGIVWHQGEADYKKLSTQQYAAALGEVITSLRKDLDAPDLPVVAGELGRYLEKDGSPSPTVVNEALRDLAKTMSNVGVASAEGLIHKGDMLHFDAASQRTFGQRYAAEMLRLQSLAEKK